MNRVTLLRLVLSLGGGCGGVSAELPRFDDVDGDGFSVADGDCLDLDPQTHPGALERCDGVDNDCDGQVDEDLGVDWYPDADGDGYGNPIYARNACACPAGYVAWGTDCDDGDASVCPGADERCNGLDDDCDGDVDEVGAVDAPVWYRDADGDGYGDSGVSVAACEQPSGMVSDGRDCDDTDATVYPGAPEVSAGVDNDCDGRDENTIPVAQPTISAAQPVLTCEVVQLDGSGSMIVGSNNRRRATTRRAASSLHRLAPPETSPAG